MSDITLPHPTEYELTPFNKIEYFNRLLIKMNLSEKTKVDVNILADWISENYDSIYLYNKPLKFNKNVSKK